QPILRGDGRIDLLALDGRRAAERANRDLGVLRLHRGGDVAGGKVVGIELVGVQPDPHRVLGAEHLDGAHAGYATDWIDHGGADVIGDVVLGHAAVPGDETDHLQETTGGLADVHA